MARKKVKEQKKEMTNAASTMQSNFRGYKTRKSMSATKDQRERDLAFQRQLEYQTELQTSALEKKEKKEKEARKKKEQKEQKEINNQNNSNSSTFVTQQTQQDEEESSTNNNGSTNNNTHRPLRLPEINMEPLLVMVAVLLKTHGNIRQTNQRPHYKSLQNHLRSSKYNI